MTLQCPRQTLFNVADLSCFMGGVFIYNVYLDDIRFTPLRDPKEQSYVKYFYLKLITLNISLILSHFNSTISLM